MCPLIVAATENVRIIGKLFTELCLTCMASLSQQGHNDERDACCPFQMHAAKFGSEMHGVGYKTLCEGNKHCCHAQVPSKPLIVCGL